MSITSQNSDNSNQHFKQYKRFANISLTNNEYNQNVTPIRN